MRYLNNQLIGGIADGIIAIADHLGADTDEHSALRELGWVIHDLKLVQRRYGDVYARHSLKTPAEKDKDFITDIRREASQYRWQHGCGVQAKSLCSNCKDLKCDFRSIGLLLEERTNTENEAGKKVYQEETEQRESGKRVNSEE